MKEKERDRKQRWFVGETERARETEREDGEEGKEEGRKDPKIRSTIWCCRACFSMALPLPCAGYISFAINK